MAETKNLGLVKAIHVGTTPPLNNQLLWYDTSLTAPIHKYYDTITETWVSLAEAPVTDDDYRLNSYSINSITDVVFSSVLSSNLYYVQVLEYIATDGTSVKSGWTISNKTTNGFRFTPPDRYLTGAIWYEVKLIK